MQKFAEEANTYVKEILRERSFTRKIIPPKYVSVQELDRNPYDDTLIKIRDKEPFSKGALAVTYRGRGESQYVESRKYVIPLTKLESPLFSKDEIELLACEAPITQIIEENAVKDIEEVEDIRFLASVNQILAQTGKTMDGPADLTKAVLPNLFNLIDDYRLKTDTLLMSAPTFNSWLKQTMQDLGDSIVGEIAKDGWVYDRILGKRVVVSIKSDVIDEFDNTGKCTARCIYSFTSPDALGDSYVLNDSKLWFKNDFGTIYWKFDEIIGTGIGNVAGIAKLRLVQP
jgi:hypothetical protein